MKKNTIRNTVVSMALLLMGMGLFSCGDEELNRRVEPELSIAESVISGPKASREVVHLRSTYPWFAEASDSWIKLRKYRGQALIQDSIVVEFDENPNMELREGWIEVRLMDQMKQRLYVMQSGRGTLITLRKSTVYFNKLGGEITLDVLTDLDWEVDPAVGNGFTLTKTGKNSLKVNATVNSSTGNRTLDVTLFDKANPQSEARTSLKLVQLDVVDLLNISLSDEEKDALVAKGGVMGMNIPVSVNMAYDCVASDSWITITSKPAYSGDQIEDYIITADVAANTTGEERIGYIVLRDKKSATPTVTDTMFISQPGVSEIIYVKPGGTGDGSSWEQAVGSFATAMTKCSDYGDMAVWVAEGVYQFTGTAVWRAVNVYGGFKGTERKLRERDLNRKSTFRGGAFIMISAWGATDPNRPGRIFWMDGIIFEGANNPASTYMGTLEFYDNHGLRNCIIRNNTYGKNSAGYFQNCQLINVLVTGNYTTNTGSCVLQCNNSKLNYVTVSGNKSDSRSGGVRFNGTAPEAYNTVIWGNIGQPGESNVAYLDANGNVKMGACAVNGQFKFNSNFAPSAASFGLVSLNITNDAADGPHFADPATSNFTPQSGSALIGKGTLSFPATLNTTIDLNGRPRSKTNPTIGAIE